MDADANAKIKCGGCNKNLLPLRFSERARQKYWESLTKNPKIPKMQITYLLCQECNVGSRQELTCCMCDAKKGLDSFSKAQRKKPDDAHCLDCQQEKEDREPEHDDEVEEVKIMDQKRYEKKTDRSGQSFLARSKGGSLTNPLYSNSPSFGAWDGLAGNHPPYFDPPSSVHSFDSSSRSSLSTRIGNSLERDSIHSVQSHNSYHSRRQESSGGFAKQNAVKKDRNTKAEERWEREKKREVEAEEQVACEESDNDDDDSENELPY